MYTRSHMYTKALTHRASNRYTQNHTYRWVGCGGWGTSSSVVSRHRWMESGGSSVFNVKFVGPVDNIMPRG